MSYGIAICSQCKREVHQRRDAQQQLEWFHCEDKTLRCERAVSVAPNNYDEIKGAYCKADEFEKLKASASPHGKAGRGQ